MATASHQGHSNFIGPRQWLWRISDAARQLRQRQILNADAALGSRGEDAAHRYLRGRGYVVVARNYRPFGGEAEVDIVAKEKDIFVFIEVKSRTSAEYGAPDRAIGADKQQRIMRAARSFTARAGVGWNQVRFDTISVVFSKPPSITHQRDVFFEGRALPVTVARAD